MENLNVGDSVGMLQKREKEKKIEKCSGGLSKIRSLRSQSQKHMEEDILQNLNSIH